MSKIDSNLSVAIVLHEDELLRMLEALRNSSDPNAWIRLVASYDTAMPAAEELVAYLQDSDGNELVVF